MAESKNESKSKNENEVCEEIFNLIQLLFPKAMSIKSDDFSVDKYDVKMTKGNSFKFTISFSGSNL